MKVSMTLERETKGAVRYQEVNHKGEPVQMSHAVLGTMYIRKSGFEDLGYYPIDIEVDISWES